jgi:hypothetical protein
MIEWILRHLLPRRFVRILHCDGGWYLCTPSEAFHFLFDECDAVERKAYTWSNVHMTQARFDALPEFEGF